MITTLLAIIWYDGASPADTVPTPPSSNSYDSAAPPIGAFAFFDQYGEAAAVIVPPPATTAPSGGFNRQAFELYGRVQHAELRKFEERDEFGTLAARQPDPAAVAFAQASWLWAFTETETFPAIAARYQPSPAELLQFAAIAALVDAEEFAPLTARSQYQTAFTAYEDADEVAVIAVRRGLPPLAVLTWFLDRME